MSNNKWSDNQINMVGAQASKFPSHEVLHWQAPRAVVERVRELLRATSKTMTQIEDNPNLSAEGKSNKLAEVAQEALAQLEKLMEPAESAAGRRIDKLREKLDAVLMEGKPKDAADAQVAAEIRAHIANSKSPAMTALKLKHHKEAVAAVLGAPGVLSGLSEQETTTFREQVLDSTKQQKETREIENALTVCRAAIKSAASMIASRGRLKKNSLNGGRETI